MFVEVVFNLAIERSFTYRLPDEIQVQPQPGQRIRAPFGTRELAGIIVAVSRHSHFTDARYINDILDEEPVITPEMLQLTKWIADYYMIAWGQAIQLALPKNLSGRQHRDIFINQDPHLNYSQIPERQRFLFDIIARENGRPVTYYREKFGFGAFEYLLRELQKKNLIYIRDKIPTIKESSSSEKYVTIPLNIQGNFSGLQNQELLRSTLSQFSGNTLRLKDFIHQSKLSTQRCRTLADRKIILLSEKQSNRNPEFNYREEKKVFRLNKAQSQALSEISAAIDKTEFHRFLLHGITGSGKTEVYIEAIHHALNAGKTAIVLIPEISLTPQTVGRFESRFPGRIAVFHSRMTNRERIDSWNTVFKEQRSIVIGPRSALFMPLRNIGIIVVDEEHDTSYKQSTNAPRYNARDVAVYRAQLNNAVIVLGSATPGLESYYNVQTKKYNLLQLPERIEDSQLPKVEIIDTTSLYRLNVESSILSPILLDKIRERLEQNEQIILLQNRRGYASFLQCIDCGYLHICPNCEITLTYHANNKSLECHYCGFSQVSTESCPKCMGEQINYRGIGTQKVEQELHKIFPLARILRMDQDTTRHKGAHDKILTAFREHRADILLGTQMISKGLDFETVTLVGVIAAEIGLTLPDYRAAERTFQLLTQVAGRSGRGRVKGEVVIQSTLSKHYAIQFAQHHDYAGFYKKETDFRREMDYPPFSRLINIRLSAPDLAQVIHESKELASILNRQSNVYFTLIGPAPAPLPKIGGHYRWHILIKIHSQRDPSGKKSKELLNSQLQAFLRKKSKETLLAVDVDPLEVM